jgi:diguanylate cyclase (GGDEF)-like protein
VVGNLSDTLAVLTTLGAATLPGDARVQRLIKRLLATEIELDALISGQADAILGATGEPLLLRDAQHAMRGAVAHFRGLAHHDPLTGAANRLLFASHLQHAIERSRRTRTRVALLYLDVDRFKEINDTFGHGAGDNLLRAFSERVSRSIRSADTMARVGGDEFAVLLEDVEDKSFAERVAAKIQRVMGEPFAVNGHQVAVSTSIGIGLFPDDANNAVDLTDVTDSAMYRAKERGRGEYAFADEG